MRLINADALYERICDLEAQALSYVGKIGNDEAMRDEWRLWSVILTERTAFKHDIIDAPTIEERKKGKWILISDGYVDVCKCDQCGHNSVTEFDFCPHCGTRM